MPTRRSASGSRPTGQLDHPGRRVDPGHLGASVGGQPAELAAAAADVEHPLPRADPGRRGHRDPRRPGHVGEAFGPHRRARAPPLARTAAPPSAPRPALRRPVPASSSGPAPSWSQSAREDEGRHGHGGRDGAHVVPRGPPASGSAATAARRPRCPPRPRPVRCSTGRSPPPSPRSPRSRRPRRRAGAAGRGASRASASVATAVPRNTSRNSALNDHDVDGLHGRDAGRSGDPGQRRHDHHREEEEQAGDDAGADGGDRGQRGDQELMETSFPRDLCVHSAGALPDCE